MGHQAGHFRKAQGGEMNALANVKVGDKIFVKSGSYDKGRIVTIDRITPSGRVITAIGHFNPNGRLRGDNSWISTYARPATEDDVAGIYRYGLVRKMEEFRMWGRLSADDLKVVAEIIFKYGAPS